MPDHKESSFQLEAGFHEVGSQREEPQPSDRIEHDSHPAVALDQRPRSCWYGSREEVFVRRERFEASCCCPYMRLPCRPEARMPKSLRARFQGTEYVDKVRYAN